MASYLMIFFPVVNVHKGNYFLEGRTIVLPILGTTSLKYGRWNIGNYFIEVLWVCQ